MGNIFSIISEILLIWIIAFVIYSIYTLKKFYGVTLEVSIPQPYRKCYKFFRDMPLVGKEVVLIRSNLALIYNSDTFAKVATAIIYTLFPIVFVSVFLICSLALKVWYFILVIGLFSCIVIYFTVTNYIVNKARNIKYKSIFIYESAERRLSNGDRVVECFRQIGDISSGFVRRISINFVSKFALDSSEAYSYFQECIGDKYSQAFVRSLMAYDKEGVDPCPEILNTISLAKRHYYIERQTRAKVSGFKKLLVVLLIIAIAMDKTCMSIVYSMGSSMDTSWMTYCAILLVLISYCMALFYERY